MGTLMQNVNPKHNPVTAVIGAGFLLISMAMFIVKYIVPAFVVLKQDIPYAWWVPFLPFGLGILAIFINDEYFNRIFNRADKVVARRTETPDKIVDEIKIEKKSD